MAAILVVLTFALFLIVDVILRKVRAAKAVPVAHISPKPSVELGLNYEELAIPEGVFFHRGHTWAGVDLSGKIKVGLDDFTQKIFGRIDGVKLRKVGDNVAKGEKLFTVKQGGRQAEFRSPIDGVISAINEDVVNNPKLIKENPYEKGWIYAIKPSNLARDIKSLIVAEDARNWIKREVQRFKEFINGQFVQDKVLGKVLADGGVPVEGIMEHMDDLSWMKLQEEFLTREN
jgi:glycine cleavage system H protein